MQPWEQFENDLAKELQMERVPGSGATWHSKLDVAGKGTRWSLKYTEKDSITISKTKVIEEALAATGGLGGTDEIPLWAFRIQDTDLVMMRKEDFYRMVEEEVKLIKPTKAQERRARSRVPVLMREEE